MKKHFINHIVVSLISLSSLMSISAFSHDSVHHNLKARDNTNYQGNPRGVETLDFSAEHINRVVTAGYPVSFGVYAFSRRQKTQALTINDNKGLAHNCVKANFLAFDVDDDYAFDINEDVSVEFLIDRTQTMSLVYGFDQHGSEKANGIIELKQYDDTKDDLVWAKVILNKARFANRGLSNTDFVITTNETMLNESSLAVGAETTLVLCDVKIARSTPVKKAITTNNTRVDFSFTDEQSQTPIRLGLYDSSGSSVLLAKESLVLPFYEDKTQQHSLPAFYSPFQFWPHNNRYYYYVDGQFSQKLPPDTYTLIATKGPEYRISKQVFTVTTDAQPLTVHVEMQRWLDLPALGWYSGDVHIHIKRLKNNNENLVKIFKAEDLHFSNLLEMSTNETNHFSQYSFGDSGTFTQDNFVIVPGIEGPRTAHRGHAIALNVREVYKPLDSFFLYDKYFKFYQQQQSVIGYAHVGSKEFNASWGLALDMPFGLIDFVEIMQNQRLRTEFWYEFLNLGFKLAPAAGSDYPYFEQPGAVRSYVKMNAADTQLDKPFKTQAWYQKLKRGNTFVSNLPYIELEVNGQPIGSKLAVQKNNVLTIKAKVSINTDYDKLAKLELIHCGKVIKQLSATDTDKDTLTFEHQFTNKDSGWLALRANGNDYALAHTGAIYLEDKQGNSSCVAQAPSIIDTMQARLTALKKAKLDVSKELEYWETNKLEQAFNQQKNALEKQIELASDFYHKMKTDSQN